MMKKQVYVYILISFIFGFIVAAFLFQNVQKRTVIDLQKCSTGCLEQREIIGILTSAGIQNIPAVIPKEIETDKAFAIKSPVPQSPVHYVIFPKKDIKNIAEVSKEDSEYLMDVYAIISELVKRDKLENYQVITNGPGYQHTSYLHFHLRAEK